MMKLGFSLLLSLVGLVLSGCSHILVNSADSQQNTLFPPHFFAQQTIRIDMPQKSVVLRAQLQKEGASNYKLILLDFVTATPILQIQTTKNQTTFSSFTKLSNKRIQEELWPEIYEFYENASFAGHLDKDRVLLYKSKRGVSFKMSSFHNEECRFPGLITISNLRDITVTIATEVIDCMNNTQGGTNNHAD